MSYTVMDTQFDKVIKSLFLSVKVDYSFALTHLVPLIDRLDQQRNTLPAKYYRKLEKDIITGCIMPPLTIAFVTTDEAYKDDPGKFVLENIDDAFVLDGIQRLNTLNRVQSNGLDKERPLYLNVLICDSMDKLLYRMITLNNGQKPMSARHQIELLAENIYNFDEININTQTEKEQKKNEKNKKKLKGRFKKGDVVKAYLAFISATINIDNQKIIESKLDELITDQIIESNLPERTIEFSQVMDFISRMCEREELYKWFVLPNNLIGFCAGIQNSHNEILQEDDSAFEKEVNKLDVAFSFLDVSKIKLGMARRRAVQYFTENYARCKEYDENDLIDKLSQIREI
ncbi:hypothetical protein ABEX29_26505 [Brevibacillus porteri]|uniref:hypothetical protein n=1 Tax=Brevibacillus porteri TaxID=2126350 RepID=UPI003D24DEE5